MGTQTSASNVETRHRSQRASGSETRRPDKRLCDALTDLNAYALTLDVECHRVESSVLELADGESSAADILAVLRKRRELAEELQAFRCAITALEHAVRG